MLGKSVTLTICLRMPSLPMEAMTDSTRNGTRFLKAIASGSWLRRLLIALYDLVLAHDELRYLKGIRHTLQQLFAEAKQ